jgi:hypothetical protein
MNKRIYLLIVAFLLSAAIYAQKSESAKQDSIKQAKAERCKPVEDAWGATMLVDAPTSLIPKKGSLELHIQHRFSNLSNGIHDLFGLYGASNIRMALQYSIIDQLLIGFATEKDNKYQEFFAKGKLLEQTQSGSVPLSLTLYGNATISGNKKDYYGVDSTYQFKDRMSYSVQLIVARKFAKEFSLEVGASYNHINKVEGVKSVDTTDGQINTTYKPIYENNIFGLTAGCRINFYNYHSFLLEYDQGFFTEIGENQMLFPKPNVAFAYELATPTHCFQVFASSYRALNPQHNFVKNQFDFTEKLGLMLGFNITVRLR